MLDWVAEEERRRDPWVDLSSRGEDVLHRFSGLRVQGMSGTCGGEVQEELIMDEMTFGDKVLAVLTIGIVLMVFAMELK